MNNDLLHYVALSKIDGIGPVLAKNLIAYCGSVHNIFNLSESKITKVPGIGKKIVKNIINHKDALLFAEKELTFSEKNNIQIIHFNDKNYPQRLKLCNDGPIVLYKKGTADLNTERLISVVGTRRNTDYGKSILRKFIKELKQHNINIVSGLAYGIDYLAHKNAVENDLCNVAVLAHGLDRIYPSAHQKISEQIIKNGALLTEFTTGTNPDRENFPKRNRIVAGMCDATVVVESTIKGGAVITAYLAQGYNRDVFAFPGKTDDKASAGCNNLIKKNIAGMIENVDDLLYQLGWKSESKDPKNNIIQTSLLLDLNENEQSIVNLLQENKKGLSVDNLSVKLETSLGKMAGTLLTLEMKNIVEAVPGNKYKLLN